MNDQEKAAAQAVQTWLLAKSKHAKAMGEVSRLGREMGEAFNKMLVAVSAADPLVSAEVDILKLAAKGDR